MKVFLFISDDLFYTEKNGFAMAVAIGAQFVARGLSAASRCGAEMAMAYARSRNAVVATVAAE